MYKRLSTTRASPPGGHYSQGVVSEGLVFVSGQLGFEPGTATKAAITIEQETLNCLGNLREVLNAAGIGLDQVLRTTIYISDVDHWSKVNAVYAEFMGECKPARAVVPCGKLHHGFRVEIEAIARAKVHDISCGV